MGERWLRGGSSECGVSVGTTERRRCQESDVTDEKPALEVEIIDGPVQVFLIRSPFGLDNYLPVTSDPNSR